MRDLLDVLTLHRKFNFPHSEYPALPEEHIFRFRHKFLTEELDEYHNCHTSRNLVGVVDSLLDFAYVACGSALFIGTPRSGPQANWPSFRSACHMLQSNGIIEDVHQTPHFLSDQLHAYTMQAMASGVEGFLLAYLAARDSSEEGLLYLMIRTLKECLDQAYKAAGMMGVPWERCWLHVANANLRKRCGIVPKRGSEYDLIKPHGWVSPEASIADELVMDGWKIPSHLELDRLTGRVRVLESHS